MKGKNNQEETYFLGKAQETRYTKSTLSKKLAFDMMRNSSILISLVQR